MGVGKLLKAADAEEESLKNRVEQESSGAQQAKKNLEATNHIDNGTNIINKSTIAQMIVTEESSSKKTLQATSSVKADLGSNDSSNINGRKRGRPKNEELGLGKRRQYTITLMQEDYESFLTAARNRGISVARLMEIATKNYLRTNTQKNN